MTLPAVRARDDQHTLSHTARRCLASGVLLLLLLDASAARAQQKQEFGLEALMQTLAAVPASQATFAETKEVSGLSEPLQSSGVLSYRAPAYLLKHVLKPEEERYELDGDRLIVESAAWGRRTLNLDAYPQLAPLVASIRATLSGDRALLERYYTVTLSGTASHWLLWLEPRDAAVGRYVRAIGLQGENDALTAVETYEGFGTRSVMTITRTRG